MAKLFPFKPTPDVRNDPQLVNINDEAAGDVFAALSSETAREILRHLYEDPATASDLAEAADTSLQNARYHLDKLMEAGLVKAVDTWYSSRGTEMTVYAPTSDPLIVTAGREERTTVLKQALSRIVGAIGVLAIASALINRFAPDPTAQPAPAAGDGEFTILRNASTTPTLEQEHADSGADGAAGGADAAVESTPINATETPIATAEPEATTPTLTPTGMETDGGLLDTLLTAPPPGVLFFTGGLLVILVATLWWYWFHYRPLYAGG